MNKVEIYVRFANESTYYNKILIDPTKIEEPNDLGDEVFCTIDGVRIAIPKKEWQLVFKDKKWDETGKKN